MRDLRHRLKRLSIKSSLLLSYITALRIKRHWGIGFHPEMLISNIDGLFRPRSLHIFILILSFSLVHIACRCKTNRNAKTQKSWGLSGLRTDLAPFTFNPWPIRAYPAFWTLGKVAGDITPGLSRDCSGVSLIG